MDIGILMDPRYKFYGTRSALQWALEEGHIKLTGNSNITATHLAALRAFPNKEERAEFLGITVDDLKYLGQ